MGPVRSVEGRPNVYYSALNLFRAVLSGKVGVPEVGVNNHAAPKP